MIFQQDFRNLVGIRFLKLIPTNLSSIIRHFECFYVVQRNKNVSKSRLAINLTSSRYTFCYTSLRVRSVSRSHSAKSTSRIKFWINQADVKFINRTQVMSNSFTYRVTLTYSCSFWTKWRHREPTKDKRQPKFSVHLLYLCASLCNNKE